METCPLKNRYQFLYVMHKREVKLKRVGFSLLIFLSCTLPVFAGKKQTIVDYYIAIRGPLDESGKPHQFTIKDVPNGYLKNDDNEVALFYKKDRTPIVVLSNQYSDSPDLNAYELINGKWEDRTKELLSPQIKSNDYISKRFNAKGVPFTPDSYGSFATKPLYVKLPQKGKTIEFIGANSTSPDEDKFTLKLFCLVFENDQFVLKENW